MLAGSLSRHVVWVQAIAIGALSALAVALYLTRPAAPRPAVPAFSHVFLIVEENSESSDVLGSQEAPYINQLASQNGLAQQYYAISHPSLPNYLALVAGDTFGITSDCTECFLDKPSIADQIEASGRGWRAYQESMPRPCFVGDAGYYAQKHDPFLYFDAIRTNADRCAAHIVPFDQFETDMATGSLPDYSFITPNQCNDGHDCSLNMADQWLARVVPTIMASDQFRNGGVLFLTWDEGSTDAGCCEGLANGGRIVTIVVSPLARAAFASDTIASHYSLLRTIEDAWGLPPLAHAAEATAMTEYFNPR